MKRAGLVIRVKNLLPEREASGSDLFSDSFQKQDKIIFHCVLKYQYLSLTPNLKTSL